MQWNLMVVEDDDHYIYYFNTWAEVLARLAEFDGLSVEYRITHSQKHLREEPFRILASR